MGLTQLSPTATPGKRYLFPPEILTALSVIALPGARHTFLPKAQSFVPSIPFYAGGGEGATTERDRRKKPEVIARQRILAEDEKILELLVTITPLL